MSFLKRIFGKSLSPTWELTPGQLIWKLQPTEGGILFGESRDVEQKKLTLFAIRPDEGKMLFSGVTLDEPWWVALEMTIGEVAVLHSFPRPDLPNAVGATALDCATGDLLWRDETIRVLAGVEELALVQRGNSFDWGALALIDARTGALLEEIGEDLERVQAFQQACASAGKWDGWISSEEVEAGSPKEITLASYLSSTIKDRRGSIEFAELDGFTVVAAHARSRRSAEAMLAGAVDTHLFIFEGDRQLYHEIVTKDAPAPAGDIFFIWRDVLIFIRDRRTLVGIDLERTQ